MTPMAADEEEKSNHSLFIGGHRRLILFVFPYFSSALIRSAAVLAASVSGYFLTIPL